MTNIVALLAMLSQLAKTMVDVTAVIFKARAEGRDVSDTELADLKAKRDEAFKAVFG